MFQVPPLTYALHACDIANVFPFSGISASIRVPGRRSTAFGGKPGPRGGAGSRAVGPDHSSVSFYSQIAKADPGNVLARFKAAALRPMAKAVTHEGTVAGDAQPAEKNPMFDAITGDITLMDEQAIARMSEPPRLAGKPGRETSR